MPSTDEILESAEVLSETSETTVDTSESADEFVSGGFSILDGNPEDSPYYVGVSETSDTVVGNPYDADFDGIHASLDALHSTAVLTVVLLAAIFGTCIIKFFFDRLKG